MSDAWSADWRTRIASRLAARGCSSITELADAHPTASTSELADELSTVDGVNRGDVAAVQVAQVWRDEALGAGSAATERFARRTLIGQLHSHLPEGWSQPWSARDANQVARAGGAWTSDLGPRLRLPGGALFRKLVVDPRPPGWLPRHSDDPELDAVFGAYWWPPGSATDGAVVYEQGHEHAPDSRWGLERFVVRNDRHLSHARRQSGTADSIAARLELPRVLELHDALGTSTFPLVPKHAFVPGASIVRVELMAADGAARRAELDRFHAAKLPGYDDIVRFFAGLGAALRTRDGDALRDLRISDATNG